MPQNKQAFFRYIAAGFGAGFAPAAPGTFGSIFGLILLWILHQLVPALFSYTPLGIFLFSLLILVTLLGGIYISNELIATETDKDPKWIVIDEIVGMWISLLLIPFTWYYLLIAFALFRFFDIKKPFHVGWADRELKGGMGIMMDDVIAGAYTNICMHLIVWIGYFLL